MNDNPGMPVNPLPVEDKPKGSNTGLIIAIVVVVVLCCCCAAVGLGYWAYQNGDQYVPTSALLNLVPLA